MNAKEKEELEALRERNASLLVEAGRERDRADMWADVADQRALDLQIGTQRGVDPEDRDAAASYDRLGRKQPTRLGYMHFARAVPGYAAQFTGRVPDEFIADVDLLVVEVACVCKEVPRLEYMVPTLCACGRYFVYDGATVRVARFHQEDETGEPGA